MSQCQAGAGAFRTNTNTSFQMPNRSATAEVESVRGRRGAGRSVQRASPRGVVVGVQVVGLPGRGGGWDSPSGFLISKSVLRCSVDGRSLSRRDSCRLKGEFFWLSAGNPRKEPWRTSCSMGAWRRGMACGPPGSSGDAVPSGGEAVPGGRAGTAQGSSGDGRRAEPEINDKEWNTGHILCNTHTQITICLFLFCILHLFLFFVRHFVNLV